MKKLFKFLSLALVSISLLLPSASAAIKPINEYMADECDNGNMGEQLFYKYAGEICKKYKDIMIKLDDKYLSGYDADEQLKMKHDLLLELEDLRKTIMCSLNYFEILEDIKSKTNNYSGIVPRDALLFMFALTISFINGGYEESLDIPQAKEIITEAWREKYVKTELSVKIVPDSKSPLGEVLLVEIPNFCCFRF